MKKLYLILALFIPLNLIAAEFYAVSKNALGQKIELYEGSDGITVSVKNRNAHDGDDQTTFVLKEECIGDFWKEIHCLPNRRSPLSGASYKYCHLVQVKGKKVKENCDLKNNYVTGVRVIEGYSRCFKGCNRKRVPQQFYEPGMP